MWEWFLCVIILGAHDGKEELSWMDENHRLWEQPRREHFPKAYGGGNSGVVYEYGSNDGLRVYKIWHR